MDKEQERDFAEEEYNKGRCPECDNKHSSDKPCIPVIPPIRHENVIGYVDIFAGKIVIDGGEWWRSVQ